MTYAAQFALIATDKAVLQRSQMAADHGRGCPWFRCAHCMHPRVQHNVHEQ
jgi:hypothetical protein